MWPRFVICVGTGKFGLRLETSVFVISGEGVKNRDDRLVMLNSVANGVVEKMRGVHSEFVFSYKGRKRCSIKSGLFLKVGVRRKNALQNEHVDHRKSQPRQLTKDQLFALLNSLSREVLRDFVKIYLSIF